MGKNLGRREGDGWVRQGGTGPLRINARGTGKLYLDLRCDIVLEEPAGRAGTLAEFNVRRGGGRGWAAKEGGAHPDQPINLVFS
jgi:hypothetical protein